jgi:hypothetical protein
MSTDEPPPDPRQVVDDLEEEVVDLEQARSGEDGPKPERDVETAADDGSRAVPGTPEPPD